VRPDRATRFAALGDPQRLRLLDRLADTDHASINDLSQGSGITRQAVTRHLRVLEDAGLAVHRMQGRESLWSINDNGIKDIEAELEAIKTGWRRRLARLKLLVESSEET